jgi:hypothetical protein
MCCAATLSLIRPLEGSVAITDVGASTETTQAGTIDMKLEVVMLPVSDVERAERFYQSLGCRTLEVSALFHRDGSELVPGPDLERRSYLTYASFNDPYGNGWLPQEFTMRLPGRIWED